MVLDLLTEKELEVMIIFNDTKLSCNNLEA